MIFKIGSNTSGTALLNYHMKKVEQDKAEVTYSSFNKEGCSASYYEGRFEDLLSENGRVYKNRYLDISANFAPEGNLSKAQKESVISEWMEEMGYGENAYILFHHKDKAHDHYHIVTVSVNVEGKKVSERDNYRRSVRVSRSLEERYGMRKLCPFCRLRARVSWTFSTVFSH